MSSKARLASSFLEMPRALHGQNRSFSAFVQYISHTVLLPVTLSYFFAIFRIASALSSRKSLSITTCAKSSRACSRHALTRCSGVSPSPRCDFWYTPLCIISETLMLPLRSAARVGASLAWLSCCLSSAHALAASARSWSRRSPCSRSRLSKNALHLFTSPSSSTKKRACAFVRRFDDVILVAASRHRCVSSFVSSWVSLSDVAFLCCRSFVAATSVFMVATSPTSLGKLIRTHMFASS